MPGLSSDDQNGHAAALAATVLVQNLGGSRKTDGDVCAAFAASANRNAVILDSENYVDWNRATIRRVCQGGSIPANAAGVATTGYRSVRTYLAGIAGMSSIRTGASAMALAGALQGLCAADQGCGTIPLTFDQTQSTCTNTGALHTEIGGSTWPLVDLATARADRLVGRYEAILPLCKNGPGGYGWLDLSTLGCSGNLATQISTPCNHAINIPTWLQTQPGNNNSVEDVLNNNWAGKVILIPLFDGTCTRVPNPGPDCPIGDLGNGNNLYYHIPVFGAFLLDHAYIQGRNDECNAAPGGPPVGGNGGTGCLKGWFVRWVTQGPVGQFDPTQDKASSLGVQSSDRTTLPVVKPRDATDPTSPWRLELRTLAPPTAWRPTGAHTAGAPTESDPHTRHRSQRPSSAGVAGCGRSWGASLITHRRSRRRFEARQYLAPMDVRPVSNDGGVSLRQCESKVAPGGDAPTDRNFNIRGQLTYGKTALLVGGPSPVREDGISRRTASTRSRSRSAWTIATVSGAWATTVPHGSMTIERPYAG